MKLRLAVLLIGIASAICFVGNQVMGWTTGEFPPRSRTGFDLSLACLSSMVNDSGPLAYL